MRLKSQLWVQAYIRRCISNDVQAVLARRGQADAGVIFIQINRLDGTCELYGPAPAGLDGADIDRKWMACFSGKTPTEAEAGSYIQSQLGFDPDLWVIEVDDAAGRHFLDDRVIEN